MRLAFKSRLFLFLAAIFLAALFSFWVQMTRGRGLAEGSVVNRVGSGVAIATTASLVSTAINVTTAPAVYNNEKSEKPGDLLSPTGMCFKFIGLSKSMAVVAPLLSVISNASAEANQILQSKKYQVNEFHGSIWLVAKEGLTNWTIFPFYTNRYVGSIRATVGLDEGQAQKDMSRSFTVSFNSEGALRDFFWEDKHELFFVRSNGDYAYGCSVCGSLERDLVWNANGELIHSNVWDLAAWRKAALKNSGDPN